MKNRVYRIIITTVLMCLVLLQPALSIPHAFDGDRETEQSIGQHLPSEYLQENAVPLYTGEITMQNNALTATFELTW